MRQHRTVRVRPNWPLADAVAQWLKGERLVKRERPPQRRALYAAAVAAVQARLAGATVAELVERYHGDDDDWLAEEVEKAVPGPNELDISIVEDAAY